MSLSLQLLTSLSYLANYNIDLGYVCHSNWVHLSWTKVIAKEKIPALFGIVFVIVIVSDTQTVKPSLYTDDERFFVVHILASWLTWLNIVGDEGHTMLQFLSIKQLPHILELLCSHSSFGHRLTANVFPAYWSTVPESHASLQLKWKRTWGICLAVADFQFPPNSNQKLTAICGQHPIRKVDNNCQQSSANRPGTIRGLIETSFVNMITKNTICVNTIF